MHNTTHIPPPNSHASAVLENGQTDALAIVAARYPSTRGIIVHSIIVSLYTHYVSCYSYTKVGRGNSGHGVIRATSTSGQR